MKLGPTLLGLLTAGFSMEVTLCTQTPTMAAQQTKPITVRFMIADVGEVGNQNLVKYLVDPFMKAHPDIKIEMQFVPQANIDTKVILDVNSGAPPNLIAVNNDLGLLAKHGALIPLTQQFQQDHINPKIFIPAAWNNVLYQGTPYALPATSNPALGLWHNPAAVKAAALNPNDPPKTWQQLFDDSIKAVKFDKHGNLQRVGWEFYDWQFAGLEGDFAGGDHLWKQTGNTRTPTPLDPWNVKFLTYLKKLADAYGGYKTYSKWLAGDEGFNGPKDYLAEGKALYTIDGFWDYLGFDQYSPTFHYAASYMPTPHGLMSEQAANPTLSWALAFPKGHSAAQLHAAWEFGTWAGITHSYLLAPTTNGSTVIAQQAEWDQVAAQTLPTDHKWFTPEFKYFTDPVKYITQAPPNVPISTYYNNELNTAADAVLFGKKTPLQALQQVQQDLQIQMAISGQ